MVANPVQPIPISTPTIGSIECWCKPNGERSVHPLVAGKDVLGEEAAPLELRDPERERPHAGQEPTLPVAVLAVALAAHLVGLGVHDLARDALHELPQQLLHVGRAVLEPRHGRAAQGRRERRI